MIKNAATIETDSSARRCVLVLDFHRSTADLFAQTLHLLGCDLPKTPPESGESEQPNHGASEPVSRLSEAILASAGAGECGWQPLDPEWHNSPAAIDIKQWALTAIELEFDVSPLFVLTDSRIGRVAHFWLAVLESAGIRPLVVIPVQSPEKIFSSLVGRDGVTEEFDPLVWLRHALEAEAASRHLPRLFFSRDGLLSDWRQFAVQTQNTFDIRWQYPSENAAATIDAVLSECLPHERGPQPLPAANAQVPQWIYDTASILARWGDEGEDPTDFPTLDRIRATFDEAARVFAPVVGSPGRNSQKIANLQQRIEEIQQEIALAKAERERAEARLSERFAETATLTRMLRAREATWESQVADAILRAPFWRFLPPYLRRRQKMALLRRSGEFDAKWYTDTYRDVAASGMDPLRHFVQYGADEGRMPSSAAAGEWPDRGKAGAK